MRRLVLIALTMAASLIAAGSAQAVVVDINPADAGQASVPYSVSNLGDFVGVDLVPGTRASLMTATPQVPTVTSTVATCDPWLTSDLSLLPFIGICSHGGSVMHANETFALTWDPDRLYGALTKAYMEQFLKDVATGSGTFTSPFAVTTQYQDASGRASNSSTYGGACIDYGSGGYTCQFGNTTGTGVGSNYNPCGTTPPCTLTDADIQQELQTHLQRTGLLGNLASGDTPLLVVLLPQGVQVCLDATLCSASPNTTAAAQFCSYHSQLNYNGTEVAYVVQPYTVGTGCDEPKLPSLPANPTPQDIATYEGSRLVGPLSQSMISAIVNPGLDGWFAHDGSEVEDNYGCVPDGVPVDNVTVGPNAYVLPPEFNNAGVIDTDPSVPACALGVTLASNFVLPSSVEPGDVVQFDGSITASTLIVPKANYQWDFGDGGTATGPSVEHTYARGGNYTVKLTVTDRGGSTSTVSHTFTVLGSNGQPVGPPPSRTPPSTALQVHLQLLPQGLRGLLRHGISLRVTSNKAADGFVSLYIPRGAARRAHIEVGRAASVLVGRGTVASVIPGAVTLRVHLSPKMAKKLGHLRHVNVSVRMTLTSVGGAHVAVDVAGRY